MGYSGILLGVGIDLIQPKDYCTTTGTQADLESVDVSVVSAECNHWHPKRGSAAKSGHRFSTKHPGNLNDNVAVQHFSQTRKPIGRMCFTHHGEEFTNSSTDLIHCRENFQAHLMAFFSVFYNVK